MGGVRSHVRAGRSDKPRCLLILDVLCRLVVRSDRTGRVKRSTTRRRVDGMKVRLRRTMLLFGVVAVVATVAAVAVSTSGAAGKKSYNIWLSYYNSSPYGIAQWNGAKQGAKAAGV